VNLPDLLNQNDGAFNAMGQAAAIRQRNELIAAEKENAANIRKHTEALKQSNRLEADRVKIEQERLKIEQARLEAEELDRRINREQTEKIKELRNLLADTVFALEELKRRRGTI
jgi:hypothetical protein